MEMYIYIYTSMLSPLARCFPVSSNFGRAWRLSGDVFTSTQTPQVTEFIVAFKFVEIRSGVEFKWRCMYLHANSTSHRIYGGVQICRN